MASLGGSGSRSNNQSMSNFSQNVLKQQLPALQNLWSNTGKVGDATLSNINALLPGAVSNQGNVFSSANQALNNSLNGGAYSGMNASDVANGINSQMQQFQNPSISAQPGTNNLINQLSPQSFLPAIQTKQYDLPGYYQAQNLPGAIQTSQSDILSQLNPMASTSNRLLNQSRLIQQDTNPNQRSNTQEIYDQMMGGHGNTYADAMAGTLQRQANVAQNNALNNIDQRAARAGMAGSSRQGVAQANSIKNINQNLQDNLAQIGYSTFDKDLGNKLDIAKQADSNNLQRYLGNQNYNMGLINAGNTQAQNAQGYNLGLAREANANNNQNLNYNLGLGQNQNQFNSNNQNYNLGYGQNVNTNNGQNLDYNLGMNQNIASYNLGLANAGNSANQIAGANANNVMNYNLGLDTNNINRQNLLSNLVAGNQAARNNGMQYAPTVQNMATAPIQTVQSPWQTMSSWADTIGGPIVLGKGSSMGNGSSKGGGGGLSIGS